VAFTDELATGVVPSGSPELLAAFGVTPAQAAGWTLFAFGVLGALVEPPLLALAHGRLERPLRSAGLAVMAVAMAAAAVAPSYALLLVALALYGPGSGLATSLAESALVSAAPGRAEAVLARWTLLGLAGDLAAPAVLAASVALGAGWRGALLVTAALAAAQLVLARDAPGSAVDAADDDPPPSLRAVWRAAAGCPPLLGWSLAAALCGLMDEVLVAFGALWCSARLEAGAAERAVILGGWVVGGLAGAAVLERLAARLRPATLLAVSGAGSAAAYAAWLAAGTWVESAILLAITGAFAQAHHPLLRARAFAALPGRPNVVLAAGAVAGALDLALPVVVGVVADGAGLLPAMLLLLVQPGAVLVAAVAARCA
jgi:predicted MFS family arabinose efflux permease